MVITRIHLRDVIKEQFCLIDEAREFHNRDYRTMKLSVFNGRAFNLLEVRNRKVIESLRYRFTDDSVLVPSIAMVEPYLNKLSFGWADIRDHAPFLLINARKKGSTPAQIRAWLKRQCQYGMLTVEGYEYIRVSFQNDEDFLLATLQFS